MEFKTSSVLINPIQKKVFLYNGTSYIDAQDYKSESDLAHKIYNMCDLAGYNYITIPKIVQNIEPEYIEPTINTTYEYDERLTYLIIGYIIGVTLMLIIGAYTGSI